MLELGGSGGEMRPRLQVCSAGTRVNDLCVDITGEYIGAAAEDGSVCISALGSEERAVHTHHRAVRAVRLAPDFGRSRERPIMTGGRSGRLNLLRKGWMFGAMAEKLVHEGEGVITAIAWDGNLVAWANAAGVKVVDVDGFEPVCFVAAPPGAPPADACPPRLVWESESSLLVSWGADVRVISIREKLPPAGAPADAPVKRFGEVTTKFAVKDALVAGIAPFGEELALLWYVGRVSFARLLSCYNATSAYSSLLTPPPTSHVQLQAFRRGS